MKEDHTVSGFDRDESAIAVTVPQFTLLRRGDRFHRYSEPYIVSMAVDGSGDANPTIDFNYMPFPKVAKGGTVRMLGDGHIIYGPKHPGSFVAVSVLVMECDQDVRRAGEIAKRAVESSAVELAARALLAANPGAAAVVGILKELTQFVAGVLKENKDDELYRVAGSFLQAGPVPYHVGREYKDGNDYVSLSLRVIPLAVHNQQGRLPEVVDV